MANQDAFFENRPLKMSGSYKDKNLRLKSAIIEEAFNTLTRARIEFVSRDRGLNLRDVVGFTMNLEIDLKGGGTRKFLGTCVSVEYLGLYKGNGHFLAEVRPWLWFLTRKQDCRIFQDVTVPEIIQELISEHGFSAHLEKKLTESYEKREFCVQYRETDFDFISRLMEEEGIYFFFANDEATEKLVLADSVSAHKRTPGKDPIEFMFRSDDAARIEERIFEFSAGERVTTGKVTLSDYNFESPKADMRVSSSIPKGAHSHSDKEFYDSPGDYAETEEGDRYARIRMEAEAVRHQVWQGASNVRTMGVGQTFKIKDQTRSRDESEFLTTGATHYLQVEPEQDKSEGSASVLALGLDFGPDNRDEYRCVFRAVPKSVPYRAPHVTPSPEIPGIQTAVVTGPSGEEIHTDKYGRVRVQFHWDRLGKKDENSSIWVRTMMPWTGKNWGMIAIPRIGQEVVVQFEEGNPDRPVVIGMLYNFDTMPPYELPENKTQSGVMTNSTKGGGGYNELRFEDKKDDEHVRFQAERDYEQIVKNDAKITVGVEKKDKGDMSLTVHRHLSETVRTGDHTFRVASGNQKVEIKKDKTEKIEGNSELTVTGDVTETVEQGSVTRTVSMGDESTTVSMGGYSVETSIGSINMKAMQEIKLEVGANSIVIDQMGVTIKGIMVKVDGSAMVNVKAPMTDVKGDGMLILKGGVTMIN
jgi:type VI secretion system secreted protein VgrG